jgi:hypothetical protein
MQKVGWLVVMAHKMTLLPYSIEDGTLHISSYKKEEKPQM